MARKTKRKAKATAALPPGLESINLNAAAIDIGSAEHYVAVPPGRSAEAVRTFCSYTAALHEMARWLKECGITTIALKSTGTIPRHLVSPVCTSSSTSMATCHQIDKSDCVCHEDVSPSAKLTGSVPDLGLGPRLSNRPICPPLIHRAAHELRCLFFEGRVKPDRLVFYGA